MVLSRSVVWLSLSAAISGFSPVRAQQEPQYLVDHSDCKYFGADHEKFARTGLNERQFSTPVQRYRLSMLTGAVSSALPALEARLPADATAQPTSTNTIDKYLFAAMKDAGAAADGPRWRSSPRRRQQSSPSPPCCTAGFPAADTGSRP